MVFLFDTNAISDLMNDNVVLIARLKRLSSGDRVVTCTVALGEIRFGIERLQPGKKRSSLEKRLGQALTTLSCESIPVSAAFHYSQIKFQAQKAGHSLDENDLWIAATTLSLGAALVTRDMDFKGVSGLAIEDWTV